MQLYITDGEKEALDVTAVKRGPIEIWKSIHKWYYNAKEILLRLSAVYGKVWIQVLCIYFAIRHLLTEIHNLCPS